MRMANGYAQPDSSFALGAEKARMLARTRRRCGEQGGAVAVDGAAVVEDGAAVVGGDGAAGVVDDVVVMVVVVVDGVDVAVGRTPPSTVTMAEDCMAATVN